ncbi:MAG: YqaJ viral recombinase family protein [Oscillospiraceae bacterium]|nr:YqaJ viral recombinase family protein [Clostridiales bacterium]MBR3353879.1 YqaJ viral recombinase family protein [Oscillospiraceae bacterium]
MLEYKHFPDREAWLKGRKDFPGIGASEAASIVGASSWMSASELWQLKTGRKEPKDLSLNEQVSYGTHAEEHIRALFMLKHPEYKLEYRPFDFMYQKERPWLRCTLDGELVVPDGERGTLEVKTAQIQSKSQYAQWNNRIPDHYLVQLLHQFLATGYSFAYLTAELMYMDGSSTLRSYYFRAQDYYDDMEWLLEEEEKFWDSVLNQKTPNVKLFL